MASNDVRQRNHLAKLREPRVVAAVKFADKVRPSSLGLPAQFGCIFCEKVLRETRTCANGHRACRGCSFRAYLLRRGLCPRCRDPNFTPAPQVDAELRAQPVHCPYERRRHGQTMRCQWTGTFADMRAHVHQLSSVARAPSADDQ